MSLSLFKSKKAREREERRDRRHAFRQAENAVDDVKDRIKAMEKESKKHWDAAREALKSGQKAAAQRALTGYRASQVLATKMEQKRWVFEQYLVKMQAAQTDNDFVAALGALNKVVKIDPERVEDVFDTAQDILGEQVDSDRFWDKLYGKEMEGATGALEDRIPSMEELSSQLEQEVAAEVGGASAPASANQAIDARVSAGQERVKKLLEGK
jgi:hypothetical protein